MEEFRQGKHRTPDGEMDAASIEREKNAEPRLLMSFP